MYATLEDVRLALVTGGGSTDGSSAASLPDDQIIDSIREAQSMVETYVASNFTWDRTLEPSVDPVRWLTRDVAAYLATLVYRRGKDLAATDPVALRYAHALRVLSDISTGRVTIVDPTAPTEAVGEPEAYNLYEGHLFGLSDFSLGYDSSGRATQPRLWSGY